MNPLKTPSHRMLTYNPDRGERIKDYIRYSELRRLVYKIADLQRQRNAFSSLAVLSLFPSEGKTLFCAALAAAYADTCRTRVLAVDTTTLRSAKSLSLRQCLDPSNPMIDFISLTEHRNGATAVSDVIHAPDGGAPGDAMDNGSGGMDLVMNDQLLVTQVTKNAAKRYGLVILDTASLDARNKNNIDPSLVAHLSDAGVLIVGSKTLNAPDLPARLHALEGAGLHLIGAVSNEEFAQ
jgi:Mrp family chromosome partitioning ATPase